MARQFTKYTVGTVALLVTGNNASDHYRRVRITRVTRKYVGIKGSDSLYAKETGRKRGHERAFYSQAPRLIDFDVEVWESFKSGRDEAETRTSGCEVCDKNGLLWEEATDHPPSTAREVTIAYKLGQEQRIGRGKYEGGQWWQKFEAGVHSLNERVYAWRDAVIEDKDYPVPAEALFVTAAEAADFAEAEEPDPREKR